MRFKKKRSTLFLRMEEREKDGLSITG